MKGEPVILGVSQIMLGLMNICLWIILKVSLSSDHHLPLNLWGIELFNLFFLGQVFVSKLESLHFSITLYIYVILHGNFIIILLMGLELGRVFEKHLVIGKKRYSSNNSFTFIIIQYIMSGTLSVVSGKKMTKRMICGSLGMNIVSSVLAGASLVILALSLEESRWISETGILCFIYGILILKLTITVLELFAALSLSASGCQTVCCSVTSVVVDLSSQELELSFPDLYHEYDEVTFLPS
ncbi:membrane-spanning 4-domains subfamily A member 4A-like isoform X2 [Marmota marmota marmota]|nr:membrane-spanning 4-domains subfamily A member 4A-like isoform X2 [Marmota marmota marmota]